MNVLGFDTSTAGTSACVLRDDGECFEVAPAPARLLEPPAHSRELLPAVADAMERAGIDWPHVDAVAVGVGPGTFTGLRIGVATARALARGCAAALHPVSSLAALAAGIDAPLRLALIDAKRGELFGLLAGAEEEPHREFVASPEEVVERVAAAGRGALAAGDGAIRFRSVL